MLKKGRVISHYEIVEEIGRGGMGVVYRARDLSLNRSVALKALPFFRSTDALARQRFEREAQAASALNHPNIVTIYELLIDDDASYIVMEFIEGFTLNEVIPANGLPANKALKYASEIADALGCAHEAGIIHRDLKPQNLLLSKRDHVKGSRLWRGQAAIQSFRRTRQAGRSDDSGSLRRHYSLRRTGAIIWRESGSSHRHLFAGRRALPDAQRESPVHSRESARAVAEDQLRTAAVSASQVPALSHHL